MQMLNPYCGVDRYPRGVVRLTISNAGTLNILGSAVINGLRGGWSCCPRTGIFACWSFQARAKRA